MFKLEKFTEIHHDVIKYSVVLDQNEVQNCRDDRDSDWQESLPISVHMPLHSHPLHYSKTSTGYPLNGEYISNWPPWRIRHCYNIMNPHGLCDLPLLFNSLFHDTTLNLACVHFESQHQKSRIYCLLVSVILHHSLYSVGI